VSSDPTFLTVYNGTLYFQADAAGDGNELWSYTAGDGSATQVDDINGSDDSYPEWLTVYDGSLYFAANGGTDGTELWRYDAGDASATQVDNIDGGSGSSGPTELTVYDGVLYFQANGDADGDELWSYASGDATASKVDDIYDGSSSSIPRSFTVYDGSLYFRARVETGQSNTRRRLFRYASGDGSATKVADIDYDNSVNIENGMTVYDPGSGPKLYFDAIEPSGSFGGYGLYSYDGPSATLSAEASTNVSVLAEPTSLTSLNGSLYFFAATSATSGIGLWEYSGGTVSLIKDSFSFRSLSQITVYDGALYFRAANYNSGTGEELWTSDGTTSGTEIVEDLNSGTDDGMLGTPTVYDGNLYFSGNNGSTGFELYRYDGSNVALVENICSSCFNGSSPEYLTVYDGNLYFNAIKDDGAGEELYRSNGLSAMRVTDINAGSGGSNPSELTVWNGRLYFQATDGSTGNELYVYDAAQDQSQLINNIDGGSGDSNPSNLVSSRTQHFRVLEAVARTNRGPKERPSVSWSAASPCRFRARTVA
jgi:ELWxxDGT repeat protein